ncbi:alpha-N-arabinofuranosidase [Cohnella soli]|uniref:non-reducing end alpha-L-arabinofuranosidase n=1 Tax=Cohnella soli TaxID=425005 RepID=A0ABW0HWU6_9BACL
MHEISVIVPEKIGVINPHIYGHFAEHIGGVIYDGIWVGEDSTIPNIRGFRKDFVDMFRKIKPAVLRWPGGSFAETYDWRDGIGPRHERPTTANFWYPLDGKLESNEMGTHEFIELCRLVGAEPYLAANVTALTPMEIRNWVEYCNYPKGSTSLAKLRGENGNPEPFHVAYWGIGNENWGSGGNMTPEDYGFEFRKYASIVKYPDQKHTRVIACGPNGNDLNWTRRFFDKMKDRTHPASFDIYGYSLHYYCMTSEDPLAFDADQWYALLGKAAYMEDVICGQRALMDAYDPERKIGIIVDEWGCWHPQGSGPSASNNLFEQQSTMRDALVAATTLNIFNNHCDKVVMANVAQAVNCLHSLFLASGDKFVATPNYHVFDMFKSHQGGEAVKVLVDAGKISYRNAADEEGQLDRVSCSASIKDGKLTLTLANCHYSEETEVRLTFHGGKFAGTYTKTVLHASSPQSYNSFEEPDTIKPYSEECNFPDRKAILLLPPASVVTIQV